MVIGKLTPKEAVNRLSDGCSMFGIPPSLFGYNAKLKHFRCIVGGITLTFPIKAGMTERQVFDILEGIRRARYEAEKQQAHDSAGQERQTKS